MKNEQIKTVAFDLGNVLAWQDLSVLDIRQRALLKAYLNRFNMERVTLEASKANESNPEKFLKEAEASIDDIYPKIHFINEDSLKTLAMVKDMDLVPSIWTNNIWAIYKWFEKIGLYDYVDPKYICNSIAMGQGNADKPNPMFYKLALQQIRNEAKEVLFIDDTVSNVEAAINYGIPSIKYDLENDDEALSEVLCRKLRR